MGFLSIVSARAIRVRADVPWGPPAFRRYGDTGFTSHLYCRISAGAPDSRGEVRCNYLQIDRYGNAKGMLFLLFRYTLQGRVSRRDIGSVGYRFTRRLQYLSRRSDYATSPFARARGESRYYQGRAVGMAPSAAQRATPGNGGGRARKFPEMREA